MKIDIIFQTWVRNIHRLSYLIVSVEGLMSGLNTDGIDATFYICAESVMPEYLKGMLRKFCDDLGLKLIWKKSNPSLSSSLNFCNKTGDAPFIMFMQDDWLMTGRLNIKPVIDHLQNNKNDYVVRLIWRNDFSNTRESGTPGLMYLDPDSRGYYFCDNPHIRKRGYIDLLGEWPDSVIEDEDGRLFDNGRCENAQNRRSKQMAGTAAVLATAETYFKHIGSGHTTLTEKIFNR